jgi:putative transposase
MLPSICAWFRLFFSLFFAHRHLAIENLVLRQQLAIYKRARKRPQLTRADRWFWILLSRSWKPWRNALIIVHPDTILRWHRQRFRNYWSALSQSTGRKPGRPQIGTEIRDLIRTMATANPLCWAPRIHGELAKLGIEISERTVSRILRSVKRPPSQTWKTFLHNHVGEIISVDFFTVPTINLRVLYVFLVLEHKRRKVLQFGVTDHPTAAWAAQRVVEALADRDAPKFLIRDRDGIYGFEFRDRMQSLGIREVRTAPQSPWQNGFAERLIGSVRRECLDHVVILTPWHLRRILQGYFSYYHQSRTHLALEKDCPEPRAIQGRGKIVAIPQVGGLHHRYERQAA